ncbi:MAG: hypothetical protein J7K57_04010 [Palaeococcus sp.]|uniref:hypothetical protein n=1 Tax=Palaeococcus sp. (in: euryarchaeotes) TaxID=2820298 RepID=UPI0025F99CEF|nr:hypothetical protein [Palaeococcus sp. (in: euryarchaeotes)]MCD6559023.1 hypothetical protein [Palaeococcus sp. (in: euryarchaeotes)]
MRSEIIKFRLAKGSEKIKIAWVIVKRASRYSYEEPFWQFLKRKFNVREMEIKEIMRFLEEKGELEILRSRDGKHLYVSTLKKISRNPVTLDKWLNR